MIKIKGETILDSANIVLHDVFTFIVDNNEYKTNVLFACALSPKVKKLIITDPLADSLCLENINDPNKEFGFFLDLMKNGKMKIVEPNQKNIEFYLDVCKTLGNTDIYQQIMSNYFTAENLTDDNLLDKLAFVQSLRPKDHQKVIDFAAKRFFKLIKNKNFNLRFVSIDAITEIISSEFLVLDSEYSLILFIQHLYDEGESIFSNTSNNNKEINFNKNVYLNEKELKVRINELYEYVEFGNLSLTDLMNISFENIYYFNKRTISHIAEKMKQIISTNATVSEDDSRIVVGDLKLSRLRFIDLKAKESDASNPFCGIINLLNHQTIDGRIQNCAMNGIVDVTASTTQSSDYESKIDPKFLCDYTNLHKTSMWSPDNELNGFVQFDFINKKVHISHYLMHTPIERTQEYPRNWSVEGSNDLDNWDVLDERKNDSHLMVENTKYLFECKNKSNEKAYRYIRIYCRGFSQKPNRYFTDLTAVEFFGRLVLSQ